MKPHKHEKLTKLWAEGHEIERWNTCTKEWEKTLNPAWIVDNKYRIKSKKVKMWQWVIRNNFGVVFLTNYFYSKEENLAEEYHSSEILQRADWTEIEVEEETE